MKKNFLYIIFPLFLVSCMDNGDQLTEKLPELYPLPKTIDLDTLKGYSINQMSGDTILPLVNTLGDTIKTGVRIPITGTKTYLDSVIKPEVVKAGTPTIVSTNTNVFPVAENISSIPVDEKLLKKIIPSKNISSYALINATGDTVQTGIPKSVNGKSVNAIQPQSIKSSQPNFKDNAINNMRYLDVDQGMSSSYITSMIEDKNGNIWFATSGAGISKYDGNSFTHYTEKEGLSNNYTWSIMEDHHGNIWVGTWGSGVCKYDGNTFTHYSEKEGLGNGRIECMLEDKKGNIWFGTFGGGVTKFTPAPSGKDGQGTFTHYTEKEGLGGSVILSMTEDRNGNIWFSCIGNGVTKYTPPVSENDNNEYFTHYTMADGLANNYVWSVFEDHYGNMWFGTWGSGVIKYDGKSFTNYSKKEGLPAQIILSIHEDKSGNIWLGTYSDGVIKFDPSENLRTGSESFTQYTENNGLSNNRIESIMEDQSGNIWFGTWGGGVTEFREKSFNHFTEKEGFTNKIVWSITEDKNGKLWFGTYGGGVYIYDGKSFENITRKQGLSSNDVMTILEDEEGNFWFGTLGAGLNKYDPSTQLRAGGQTFTYYTIQQGLCSNRIQSMLEDSKGNIWVGTYDGGVSMYDPSDSIKPDGKSFTNYTEKEGLSSNNILSIMEDKDGNIWFGTNGGGVCKLENPASKNNDEKTFICYSQKEGLSNNHINYIREDNNGNIWFGSDGAGVSLFNGTSFTYFTEQEGLSNSKIWSILPDNKNNLWLTTEKGISYFTNENNGSNTDNNKSSFSSNKEINTTSKLISFDKPDGLKGIDFYLNSVCLDSKNRIWWGSGKSLTMLDLSRFQISEKIPEPVLKQINIDDAFIDFRNLNDSLKSEIHFKSVAPFNNYPVELELPYNRNHLTFFFTAIDWAAPHKIKYSYKMQGLNEGWSQPSDEPKADYRNLPYGDYTFSVSAIGESQIWSAPLNYSFTILPPWWHTWWARSLYIISSLVLIFLFMQWRTAKLKQRQKELETEVENATQELRVKNVKIEKQKHEVEKQKEVIEEKQQEIVDSITYAKRIQTAILPPARIFKEHFPDSFIFYKPKDIVAGDFYWMESFAKATDSERNAKATDSERKENQTILFAAADCTGHGVPGAMVSVLCNGALNRSVREFGLSDPGLILDKAREIIIAEFEKSDEEVKDGMDISLCSISPFSCLSDVASAEADGESLSRTRFGRPGVRSGVKLEWAGANNPLWIIRNNHSPTDPFELIEIKADKQPIGKYAEQKPFTTHKINLQKGDAIYIFTDGFQDQFGGEKGKKFKASSFKTLLLSIQNETMETQKNKIDEVFKNWKGQIEQIDDVCIIGVRI